MHLTIKRFDALTTTELYALLAARVAVFVVEQSCPYQEADGRDFAAYHLFYEEDGQITAYLRILDAPKGSRRVHIGRVLTVRRGCGLGKALMLEALEVARTRMGADSVYLEAQSYAKGFYEALGFAQISEEFLEDGIPHMAMLRTL